MELNIKNIKQFADAYFYISNDHVLIHGPSGTGKSTILDCIYFAITGKRLSKKWSLYSRTKEGSVRLKTSTIEIYRTINPQSLSVNNGECTEDEAQALIDAQFKPHIFRYIGYAIQKTPYLNLLSSSPRERMLLFEQMFFSNIDTDMVRNQVKTRIHDLKEKCTYLDGAMGTYKDSKTLVVQPRITQDAIDTYTLHVSTLGTKNETYQHIQHEYELLTNQLNYKQAQFTEYKQEIHHLEIEIEQLVQSNSKIQPVYDTMHNDILKHDEYKIIMKRYNDWATKESVQLQKQIDRLQTQVVDTEALAETILIQQQMMHRLKNYTSLKQAAEQLGYNAEQHAELQEKYKAMYFVYDNCPKCSTQLRANFHGIYTSSTASVDDVAHHPVTPSDKGMMLSLEKTLHLLDIKKGKYMSLSEQMETEHKNIQFPVWTDTEYEQNLGLQNSQKRVISQLQECRSKLAQGKKMFSQEQSMSAYDDSVISDAKYKQYQTKIHTFNDNQVRLTCLRKSVADLKDKMTALHQDIQTMTHRIEHISTETNQLKEIVSDLESCTVKLARMKETHAYQELYYEYMKHKQTWDDYDKFIQIFNTLQREYMINMLNNINLYIKKYIDGFFEHPIKCTFYLNEAKQCIDFDIVYTKMHVSDYNLSTLSGGEYDRVVLAIFMSFGEYFKLPILLMDEIINSLDSSTAQHVIEHIQAIYPPENTVIYVGHQVLTGFFNNVIQLDDEK